MKNNQLHCVDRFSYLIQLPASGHGHIRPSAALAAADFGDFPYNIARLYASLDRLRSTIAAEGYGPFLFLDSGQYHHSVFRRPVSGAVTHTTNGVSFGTGKGRGNDLYSVYLFGLSKQPFHLLSGYFRFKCLQLF